MDRFAVFDGQNIWVANLFADRYEREMDGPYHFFIRDTCIAGLRSDFRVEKIAESAESIVTVYLRDPKPGIIARFISAMTPQSANAGKPQPVETAEKSANTKHETSD